MRPVSFLIVLLSATLAQACGVCGISSCSNCSVKAKVFAVQKTPVVVAATAFPFVVSANQQGATVYGYEHNGALSFNDYAGAYAINPGDYMAQADRHAQHSLELANKAVENFSKSAKILASDAATIAKIRAAGQATAEAIKAAVAPEVAEAEKMKPKPTVTIQTDPKPAAASWMPKAGAALEVLESKCSACHSGANPKGGFTVEKQLDAASWDRVVARITTADPSKRMPKGDTLNVQEFRALIGGR